MSQPIIPFNPFHSQRLTYRAANATATQDENFVYSIQSDAEAQTGSSYGLLRPETYQSSKEFLEYISSKCLLGVIICLPNPASQTETTHANTEKDDEKHAQSRKEEEEEEEGEETAIGILCLKATPPSQAPHRWTDISIDIHRDYRGRGYGAEAIRWGLWWAFQMAGLHRVQIQAFSFNTGAMRLYERLGFREEGRLRDHMWFNGRWHDGLIYGMLEHEWRDGQRKAGRDLSSCV
ncbi:putative GNAT family acetyltransferase [Poronia punctata]|nr:putative GNAT family acetyltransferase [Poronia punctata]